MIFLTCKKEIIYPYLEVQVTPGRHAVQTDVDFARVLTVELIVSAFDRVSSHPCHPQRPSFVRQNFSKLNFPRP